MLSQVPEPPLLTTAFVAFTPLLPLTPLTINGLALALTRLRVTAESHAEGTIARLTTILWHPADGARALLLATATFHAAWRPTFPFFHLAVDFRFALAFLWEIAILIGLVTRPSLLQCAVTMFSLTFGMLHDGPRAPLDAIAFLCASTPGAPFIELTILCWNAFDLAVARNSLMGKT
jgi:hypothetical protein